MTAAPIHICGMGGVSALGSGLEDHMRALRACRNGLRPLRLFAAPPDARFPVGEAAADSANPMPRTHQLACLAAGQALHGSSEPPDAVVLGITTGGMPLTEDLLAQNVGGPEAYRYHAVNSVTETVARRCGCTGPLITVSTACSSGAVAIKLAVEMLRSGMARRVLAGGADGLCRLTYFGFHSLQLVDSTGARPLDRDRRGMSLADGAAMLLLSTEAAHASGVCILGGGLSCDAYHPSTPHPEGRGAVAAMKAALADAGVAPDTIDYINLHGTGTVDNDRAEAVAVNRLFGEKRPDLSSIKGLTGHSLAAAGAIEAVVTALCVKEGLVPPNGGFETPDVDLNLTPVTVPVERPIPIALSNSFGFGGNNAALVIGTAPPERPSHRAPAAVFSRPFGKATPLMVKQFSCLSGVGRTEETIAAMLSGKACSGCLSDEALTAGLPSRTIRRLKRLPRMALALAKEVLEDCPVSDRPSVVSFGTGWGAMTETHRFLTRLFETEMQFPSPGDFIGSVHNAPAGQIAMMFNATGANVTTSGGDASFEQALLTADLLTRRENGAILLVAADEAHAVLSPRFDLSVSGTDPLSDGGGAFVLERPRDGAETAGVCMEPVYYRSADAPECIDNLLDHLGGAAQVGAGCGMILAGMPSAHRAQAKEQLSQLISRIQFNGPVVDYRKQTGEFATTSAVAAAAAVKLQMQGEPAVPAGKDILLLGLGPYLTAVRVFSVHP